MAAIEEIQRTGAATFERRAERAARARCGPRSPGSSASSRRSSAPAYPRLDPVRRSRRSPARACSRSVSSSASATRSPAGSATLQAAAAAQRPPGGRRARARADARRPAGPQVAAASNADLGLPGCTTYHVRPRAGLLGMLMGWWQVKISAVVRNANVAGVTSPNAAASAARRDSCGTPRGGRLAGETADRRAPQGALAPVPARRAVRARRHRAARARAARLRLRPRPRDAAVAGSRSARSAASTPRRASTSRGYKSHSTMLAGVPAVGRGGAPLLRRGPVAGGRRGSAHRLRRRRRAARVARTSAALSDRDSTTLPAVTEQKRMQLRGLHHITAISGDLDRTIAFYRDLLGLAIVHDGPSDDDPAHPPRVVRGARRRRRDAAELHAVPRPAQGRGRDRARRTTSR